HNVYIDRIPETHRYVFIPWDLDLAFHPYPGENKPADRLLAIPDVSDKNPTLLKDRIADDQKQQLATIPKEADDTVDLQASDEQRAPLRRLPEGGPPARGFPGSERPKGNRP